MESERFEAEAATRSGTDSLGGADPVAHPEWWPREAAVPRPLERPSTREIALASGLFLATCASTWLTGGPLYAIGIMTILLFHEFGHYLTCRKYRVPASLPLFLPLPLLSPFGTLGAIIRMRAPVRDRKTLFDIGIAGPLAGILPALVATVVGLRLSAAIDPEELGASMQLGGSLLFHALETWFFGGRPEGTEVLLHPLAFAGWAGLFVTALNLIPVGQLDGGHVAYGLFGRRAVALSYVLAIGFAVAGFWFPGWWVFLALLLLLRLRHPPTRDERIPLSRSRVALGVFALLFFVLSFVPRPIQFP